MGIGCSEIIDCGHCDVGRRVIGCCGGTGSPCSMVCQDISCTSEIRGVGNAAGGVAEPCSSSWSAATSLGVSDEGSDGEEKEAESKLHESYQALYRDMLDKFTKFGLQEYHAVS